MNPKVKGALLILLVVQLSVGIELELTEAENMESCTIIMSTFDPVNVELKFPSIPGKSAEESFGIRVTSVIDYAHQNYIEVSDNYTYRNSYSLVSNVPYRLCVVFNTPRPLNSFKPIYVGFTASEDFQSLIGGVEIPSELASEDNLKTIYRLASKLNKVSDVIMGHQVKQRKLEDDIVTRNVHKEKRIMLLGVVEVLIIILCGIYQIFALRKFLIQKNLY